MTYLLGTARVSDTRIAQDTAGVFAAGHPGRRQSPRNAGSPTQHALVCNVRKLNHAGDSFCQYKTQSNK